MRHENGKKSFDKSFKDGKKHGVWTEWTDSGKKISKQKW